LTWIGKEEVDYYSYLKSYWEKEIFPTQSLEPDPNRFFDQCLHDGIYQIESTSPVDAVLFNANLDTIAGALAQKYQPESSGLELVIYEKVSMGDGTQANNPWLQEMPDPISKACWDNYLTIPQSLASELGIEMVESNTQLLQLKVGGKEFELPAMIQPGQANGTVGIALGYGRTHAGLVANGVGVNAFPLITDRDGIGQRVRTQGVELKVSGSDYQVPQTQTHHTFMERDFVIQESTLAEYQKDPSAGRHHPRIAVSSALEKQLGDKTADNFIPPRALSLWDGHQYPNHHWAMVIDMNSCIGCGICSVACQAENNVPVVGREEVLNRREMTWLRIDRYYSSKEGAETYEQLEEAAENPEVTFQPMMCQHCNNAPCETVCPVAATTHSTEGLNQMTYNRCVGTRYCANNCPYKVRRFNWFKYHDNARFDVNLGMNNDLGKMVLNPDVTVRSRGVMEKCSFCVQRIQYGKLEAKKKKRRPLDGEIVTACASACPTDAIVFGDVKDPESKVAKLLQFEDKGDWQQVNEPRAYNVLEEINVKPNVWYFTKIRNKEEEA
jgi:molybdopterin-containing oxidoreductase family iron-sulfur binding subunit